MKNKDIKIYRGIMAGKMTLIALDSNEKFLIGITRKPKDTVAWVRGNVTSQDRKDILEALKETYPGKY
jgi:hypothetical protein